MAEDDIFTARIAASFDDIDAEAWDACCPKKNGWENGGDNPFVRYAFLRALEASGSATEATGWLGQHILIEDASERLIAAAPMYLKSHSQGEYVFDHGWANAFEQAGGRYYPKLQGGVPFTPATGPRLLAPPGTHQGTLKRKLAMAVAALTERHNVSSAHFTFLTEGDAGILDEIGYLIRHDTQYHWQNDGYGSFDDFLSTLTSRKRKTIRRERRAALAAGIDVEVLTGDAITETHWDHFFAFYQDTGTRKWGTPYLTREFFSMVGQDMGHQIVLILARRDGRYIAAALNFLGADTLFGRYWGAAEHHPFLHFELAYYQAIEFAIAGGLKYVEAGAQGEHKIARGYLPIQTRSAHYIPDPGFRSAIADYLRRERHAVADHQEFLGEMGPFKKKS